MIAFANGELCAIVVDEAQNLSWELLEEIRLLTNLETSSEKLVQIVLSGQPELEEKLRDPCRSPASPAHFAVVQNTAADQRGDEGLHREETPDRGRDPARAFHRKRCELVHHYSKGIPRLINLICEHAMISAYVEQIKPIPPRIVESVCTELDLDQQPFVISPMALSGFPEDSLPTAISSSHQPVADSADSLKDSEL